jgi:hypothetical protein
MAGTGAGSVVPPGNDEIWRQINDLGQRVQQLFAIASGGKAIATAVQTGLGTLASGGTTWAGPVASPSTVSAAGAISGGTVTGGTVAASSDISAGGDLHGQNIYATAAPGFVMTSSRVAGWWETATGRGGTASSSQRFKTALRAADIDDRARRILQIVVGYFEYLAEIAKRDDPSCADYVGPHYHVSTNLGAIAEQLHALGLWEWVVYEREPIIETMTDADGNDREVIVSEQLKRDGDGNPIPFGIHDNLIGWAALLVDQYQQKRLDQLTSWATSQGFRVVTA